MTSARPFPTANAGEGKTPPGNPVLTVVEGEGDNTRIHYVMTDEDRVLAEADIILSGRLGEDDIAAIRATLDAEDGFDPDHVGIPALGERMPVSWTPSGYETHTISRVTFTNAKPTYLAPDADDFAIGFEKVDLQAHMTMR